MTQADENKSIEQLVARRYLHLSNDVRLAPAENNEHLPRLGETSERHPLLESKPAYMLSMRTPLSDSESERLLESLLGDQRMMVLLKPYMVRLRATLRRAHLLDDSILGTHQQIARQLVQLLIQLSHQSRWLTQEQQQQIQKNLEYLIEHFNQEGSVVFQEVILALSQILIQRHKQFQQNIGRVLEVCEGEQRLQQARKKLLDELTEWVAEQPVPQIIVELFQLGWGDLLLSAYLKQGGASSIARRGLALVRHLMMHHLAQLPEERQTAEFQQKIIHAIKESLSGIHYQQNKVSIFLTSLSHYLLVEQPSKNLCVSWQQFISQALPWAQSLARPEPLLLMDEASDYALPTGSWISYDALIEKEGAFKLVWQAVDGQRLIFVNRLGIKSLEKSAEDFITDLKTKKARVLTEKNCSTTDVGLDEIIRMTYGMVEASSWASRLSVSSGMEDCLLRAQPVIAVKQIPQDWYAQLKAGVPLTQIFPPLHYEILLGVRNSQGEIISPVEFIHAAERDEHILQVDRWVITQTFNWLARHPALWQKNLEFSINLSGQSVNDASLLEFIFAEFKRTHIPHQMIGFEVTETSAVANIEQAEDFIQEMKRIGCRFALDDFGTGLSSYGYLKSLSVDRLKIDGIFVRNIAVNPADYVMVKSITEMGHALTKGVVAEFVSSAAALEKMIEIGVDYVQGHFVGMPQLLEELIFQETF